ncbi:MAG: glycoside hydrolase family 9 protein, partial [Cytophagales bacterium]|nr:glycoside hydrolase family 9 protein [Cytophagales bacterium]
KRFSGVRKEMYYVCLFVFALLTNSYKCYALTTGTIVSFVSGTRVTNHASNPSTYTFSNPSNQLSVVAVNAGTNYPAFTIDLPQVVDLSKYAYLRVKVKTTNNLNLRIDYESNGLTTNGGAVSKTIPAGSNFAYYTYSITGGNFSQSYPTNAVVDPTTVSKLWVYFNPGGNPSSFSGTVVFDSIWVGDYTGTLTPPEVIGANPVFLNQIGFYPKSNKIAVVPGTANIAFLIVDSLSGNQVYNSVLGNSNFWDASNENVSLADFSSLTTPGNYFVSVPGYAFSSTFKIAESVHENVAKSAMKAFYYQRASTAIDATHGGIYARAAGHPDNNVIVHPSAATTQRPSGTSISAPKGWYDAGDYNKYVVNSGISTNTLLAILESYPVQVKNWDLNIPESGDSLPDILNEALWNIRWMLAMQDPNDGGVYHKLTDANFSGFVMPNAASNTTRYVVQKSTAATLDFAAVMAQASRIVKNYPNSLPGLADSCLTAAINAWKWAVANPTNYYVQNTLNANYSPKINTGEYGDSDVTDEFHWAALELYITTKDEQYFTSSGGLDYQLYLPSWPSVRTLGYYSLVNNRTKLTSSVDTNSLKSLIINFADVHISNIQSSPYSIAMQTNQYYWGSNGNVGNQIVSMLMAYQISGEKNYLRGALHNLDYLLGRNPTGYSFVTGYGKKSTMNPHHRPSAADGILNPIPGFVAGGPQPDHSADGCAGYPSSYAAKSYLDSQCSYSTNEVAINWNAPLAYAATGIEFEISKIKDANGLLTLLDVNDLNSSYLSVFPNPTIDKATIISTNGELSSIEVWNTQGIKVINEGGILNNEKSISLQDLSSGVYIIKVLTSKSTSVVRIIKM